MVGKALAWHAVEAYNRAFSTRQYEGCKLGAIAAVWGFLGVSFILCGAIYRLFPIAWQVTLEPLSILQWLVLVGFSGFMLFAEGYRGFQQGFSPRVAARIRYLHGHPTWLRTLLAPLFCMGFFHTTRKRKIVVTCLTIGLFCLVQVVHLLQQPWRGIIDVGVILGLAWGWLALVAFTWQAFTDQHFNHSPELP